MVFPIVLAVSLGLAPDYEVLTAQANEQYRAGNFEQAEQTYRRALAAAPGNAACAMITGNLAGAERALKHFAAAEELAQRSIVRLENEAGKNSVLLVPVLNTLGGVLIDTHRYGEAEAVLKRAIRLGSGEAGAHYATSLHNLAAVYQLTGWEQRAEKLYGQALQIRLHLFGPDDPLTRATVSNIRALEGR